LVSYRRPSRTHINCALPLCIFLLLPFLLPSSHLCLAANNSSPPSYVGIESCRSCHRKEYDNFTQFAKKSRSFESIERVKKGLTDEELRRCYACHTTGYGKPGGFISEEKTPHLKNAGCEVCHGPGGQHLKSRSRAHIKKSIATEDCAACHTSERVTAFRYKPLIHGGAH
jgi:hypothetical protein